MSTQQITLDEFAWQLRRRIHELQRYSFFIDSSGGLRRVPDKTGRWIELDLAAGLCEPEMVDVIVSEIIALRAISTAKDQPK